MLVDEDVEDRVLDSDEVAERVADCVPVEVPVRVDVDDAVCVAEDELVRVVVDVDVCVDVVEDEEVAVAVLTGRVEMVEAREC